MNSPLPHLIGLCEDAREGSRELDAAIMWSLLPAEHQKVFDGVRHFPMLWIVGRGRTYAPVADCLDDTGRIPRITTSLDAALALVSEKLPDARVELVIGAGYASAAIATGWAVRERRLATSSERTDSEAALAVCAALLRALEPHPHD